LAWWGVDVVDLGVAAEWAAYQRQSRSDNSMFRKPLVQLVKNSRAMSLLHYGPSNMLVRYVSDARVSLDRNATQGANLVVDAALPRLSKKSLFQTVLYTAKAYHVSFPVAMSELLEWAGCEATRALMRCIGRFGLLVVKYNGKHTILGFPLLSLPLLQWSNQGIEEFAVQLGMAGGSYSRYDRTSACGSPDHQGMVLCLACSDRFPSEKQRREVESPRLCG
jgi:hypothetical protein